MKKNHLLITNVIVGVAMVVRLLAFLAAIYLTLGWKVRRARMSLEKELAKAGMPEESVKRIGAQYAALKDNTIDAMKRSFTQVRFS